MLAKIIAICGFWMVSLGSLASLAAPGGDSRLAEAAARRDLATVRTLIQQHVDANAPEADGATALAWAAYWDDLPMADLLIHAGANANVGNDYGVTPLSLACTNRSAAMVAKLLAAKASPNSPQQTGETPFMECVRTGDGEAVKSLLGSGADANAKESGRGQTALMWAVAGKHADVARLLIDKGADVHARSQNGFTPLLFAAQQGDMESARMLLEAGADVNEAANGMTPLLVASSSGHGPLCIFLLDKGAEPNAADSRGYTALHYAASNRGLADLLNALLAHKANPSPRLTKGDAGATPFYLAAAAGNVPAMRALVAAGADPQLPTKENTTPLLVAAGVGRFEARSPAQDRNALEVVKLAIELGADVNAVGESGWTALHGAAYTGSDAIIQVLVDKGAKLDVFDTFGQTPLSIAEAVVTKGLGENADVRPRRLRESTVALLLKLGATPTDKVGVEAVGSMAVKPTQ